MIDTTYPERVVKAQKGGRGAAPAGDGEAFDGICGYSDGRKDQFDVCNTVFCCVHRTPKEAMLPCPGIRDAVYAECYGEGTGEEAIFQEQT